MYTNGSSLENKAEELGTAVCKCKTSLEKLKHGATAHTAVALQ